MCQRPLHLVYARPPIGESGGGCRLPGAGE